MVSGGAHTEQPPTRECLLCELIFECKADKYFKDRLSIPNDRDWYGHCSYYNVPVVAPHNIAYLIGLRHFYGHYVNKTGYGPNGKPIIRRDTDDDT